MGAPGSLLSTPAARLLAALLLASLSIAAAPRLVSAQEAGIDRTAAARALFEEGLEHAEAGDWPQAADRFQRALSLRPSPQITYNLAGALIEMGRFVRASELLRQVATDPTVEPEVRDAAADRREEILPRAARLTLRLDPSLDGGEVMLDERPVDAAVLGVSVPVDPGAHRITVLREGQTVLTRELELAEGAQEEITLREGDDGRVALEASSDLPDVQLAPAEPAGEDPATSWWLWTIVVSVVALAGAGVAIGVVLAGDSGIVSGNGEPGVVFVGNP